VKDKGTEDKASIKIYRLGSRFRHFATAYRVVIDKAIVGEIWPLEVKEFLITPGSHDLYVEYLWRRCSQEISLSLAAGEDAIFSCRSGWIGFPNLRHANGSDLAEMEDVLRN
jgi:hypothetical protein